MSSILRRLSFLTKAQIKMKKTIVFSFIGLGVFLGLFLSSELFSPVVFESLESVTENGQPIFNQVKFIPGWKQDTWVMRQSHKGFHPNLSEWDRLTIVVDKTQSPYRSTFYQYAPGELEPGKQLIPFKARCYACHVSGPRAILPNNDSSFVKLSIQERVRVALWNLRIKSYGAAESLSGQNFSGQNFSGQNVNEGAPFKSSYAILSRPLGLKSCSKCHRQNGIRNELKLEHIGTARFLVKNGLMPPFPFHLSAADREALNDKL